MEGGGKKTSGKTPKTEKHDKYLGRRQGAAVRPGSARTDSEKNRLTALYVRNTLAMKRKEWKILKKNSAVWEQS